LPAGARGRQILIVDDEEDVTEALEAGLEREGFVVQTFNNPRLALDNIKPGQFDLAIFDIRMPEMNGFELYREFRKLDKNTVVCFFTAFEMHKSEFEELFPDTRVKAFFKKPMTIAHMTERLNELLDGHELPQSINDSSTSGGLSG
jgi:DNA-binding response OmpR family regulator